MWRRDVTGEGVRWCGRHLFGGIRGLVTLGGLVGEAWQVIVAYLGLLGLARLVPPVWAFLSDHGAVTFFALYGACVVQSMFLDYRVQRVRADDAEDKLSDGDKERAAMWPLVQEQLRRLATKLEALKFDVVGTPNWNIEVQTTALHDWLGRAFGHEVARHVEFAPQRNRTYGGEPDPIPPPEDLNGPPYTRWHLDLYARELRRLADHGRPAQLKQFFRIGPDPF